MSNDKVAFNYVFSVINRCLLLACYTTIDDMACRANNVGNASDEIFYRTGCINVTELCGGEGFEGINATFCRNATHYLPINDIFTRTLSSEEFF